MMITLHGFAASNYYNIVKHVLLYKNIPFVEDTQYGGNDEYLALSPAGKIPALTTEGGVNLSESSVCCDYLEETYPEKPLYPADSTTRAQVRQMMRVSELYLELPCRRLIPYVFAKKAVPAALEEDVRSVVSRGAPVRCVTRVAGQHVVALDDGQGRIEPAYFFRATEKTFADVI